MVTMTPNRATDRVIRRARLLPTEFAVAGPVCAATHASARHISLSTVAPTPTTNATDMWLGDAQSSGFGSEYATKRIHPGRLEGMT